MAPEPNADAVTTDPSPLETTRIKREIQREGGRVYDFPHSDREYTLNLPGKLSGKMKPTAVAKCNCGRPTVATIPHDISSAPMTGDESFSEQLRVCIVCDGLNYWDRYSA